jgi:hypothetical protein
MNKSEFLAKAIEHLISEGKSIKLANRNHVQIDGVKTGGYCTSDGIVVAVKREYWFETFIHEYCHFLQELDPDYNPSEDDWEDYDYWLLGKKRLSKKTVERHTNAIREMEIDCEKRVVKLIEEYQLPIDKKRYIQEANVYALFYTLATKYRMWYKGESPCAIKELADMMPTTFRKTWDDVPKEFERIVKERCFKLK